MLVTTPHHSRGAPHGVITMEIWETIRIRCRRDGEKIKPVARDLGLSPNTVRRYLRQDTPPKARVLPRPKLLDAYRSHIDELIRSTPHITAARIGSYLRQNVDGDLNVGERAAFGWKYEDQASSAEGNGNVTDGQGARGTAWAWNLDLMPSLGN